MRSLAWIGAVGLALVACDPVVDETCTPLDTPSFSNVYDLVIVSSCAVGGSCHGGGSTAGNLDMGNAEDAHEALVDGGRVVVGDAPASLLMDRLDSSVSHSQHMPPGTMLGEAERCMIAAWIDAGAEP